MTQQQVADMLWQEYLYAKRRWRRFTKRPPRRVRFRKGKQTKRHYATDFQQNPKDKDGKVMKCHQCGSTTHLRRKCPQLAQSGKGGGKGSAYQTEGVAQTEAIVPVPKSATVAAAEFSSF